MRHGRGFRSFALALLLCGTMIWTACSTSWVSEAEQIVAALVPAVSNVLALVAALQGKSVSAQDLQSIQSAATQAGADLQLIQSLIGQYESADASAKPGLLGQIQSAINTVQTNLKAILPALHIQDAATQAKITAVVGIVLSEVQSLAAIVPLVDSNAGTQMKAMARTSAKTHPPLKASEFVTSYNAAMTAKTGNAAVDRATAGLKIHSHSKLARWATAGLLK
jgi:hypothetical protein